MARTPRFLAQRMAIPSRLRKGQETAPKGVQIESAGIPPALRGTNAFQSLEDARLGWRHFSSIRPGASAIRKETRCLCWLSEGRPGEGIFSPSSSERPLPLIACSSIQNLSDEVVCDDHLKREADTLKFGNGRFCGFLPPQEPSPRPPGRYSVSRLCP